MTLDELKELCKSFNLVCEEYRDNWRQCELKGYKFLSTDKTYIFVYFEIPNNRVHFIPFNGDNQYTQLYEKWNHNIVLIKNLNKEKTIEYITDSLKQYKTQLYLKKQREIENDFQV